MLSPFNPQVQFMQTTQKHSRKLNYEEDSFIGLLQSSLPLFEKPYEHRTATQLAVIHRTIQKVHFFKALQKISSQQTMKSLLKYGKILKLNENRLINSRGSNLDHFVLGLAGKFGIIDGKLDEVIDQNQDDSVDKKISGINDKQPDLDPITLSEQSVYSEYLQEFKNFSPHYLHFLKKKEIRVTQSFKPTKINLRSLRLSKEIYASLDKQILFFNRSIFQNKSQIKKVSQNIVTLGTQNYIFEIDFKKLCELMREQYNRGVLKQTEIFLTFNCFKLFKKEKLKQMVEDLKVRKMKKNEVLFAEGQQDNRIFILIKGEIILERNTSLGTENPNTLYKNRLSIKRSSFKYSGRQKISMIPYADFSKVYNASTQLKKVKLTTLSPISILGQEEVIFEIPRQTTAKVSSFGAELYEFTIEGISKYITTDSHFGVEDLLKTLEEEITQKKILYRQEKLGGQVDYLNKNTQNGFYLDDNKDKLQKNKKSMVKMNQTISLKPSRTIENDDKKQMFLTATFNCHNFEEFYESKKTNRIEAGKESKRSEHKDRPKRMQLSIQQKQILKLLHGNERTIMKTSQGSRETKSQRKSAAFSIDIDRPLFTPEYFQLQLDESRRIDKEMKKSKLKNLYSSNMSFSFSKKKSYSLSNSVARTKDNLTINSLRRNLSYQV